MSDNSMFVGISAGLENVSMFISEYETEEKNNVKVSVSRMQVDSVFNI